MGEFEGIAIKTIQNEADRGKKDFKNKQWAVEKLQTT